MGPDPPRKSLCRALFSLPPRAGCHRTVLLHCGLPRTGHRGVAEPCDLFFALAPRSHDHQGDSRPSHGGGGLFYASAGPCEPIRVGLRPRGRGVAVSYNL